MNMDAVAKFLKESGMRKVGSGMTMFLTLCVMRAKFGLTPDEFKPLVAVIVATLMAANYGEHREKAKTAKAAAAAPEVKPDAPAA